MKNNKPLCRLEEMLEAINQINGIAFAFDDSNAFEVKWQTGEDCKELRERHNISLEEMEGRYGYPVDTYKQWEESNIAVYTDAMRSVYRHMWSNECTSSYEFALGEILYRYPFLKIDKVVQQILEKYEVFEILGEDVEEWVK